MPNCFSSIRVSKVYTRCGHFFIILLPCEIVKVNLSSQLICFSSYLHRLNLIIPCSLLQGSSFYHLHNIIQGFWHFVSKKLAKSSISLPYKQKSEKPRMEILSCSTVWFLFCRSCQNFSHGLAISNRCHVIPAVGVGFIRPAGSIHRTPTILNN